MRLLLVLAIGAGCVPPGPVPVDRPSAFGCTGAPERAEIADPEPGRIEVRKLRDDADGVHLEVTAERANAVKLAVLIGNVVGIETHVAAGLEVFHVSFYTPDATIAQLDALLAGETGVRIMKDDRVLRFRPPGGGSRLTPDLEPYETHRLEPTKGASAEQIAALFCRSAASPRGWAQVVGGSVVITDRRTYLRLFDAMMAKLNH